MRKQFLIPFMLLGAVVTISSSCVKKKFDSPPEQTIPVGNVITISQLRDTFNNVPITFTEDISFYGIITMDDRSGNIYKNAYIQDATGAICLRTLSSGGLYQGDSVRINLKGTTLSMYAGLLQIDSVNVDKNIIKQATQRNFEPETVTIQQLNSGNYQSKLIKLEGVEFVGTDLGKTYANAVTQSSENRTLTDCNGNTIIVRSSGYASFAGTPVPTGSGSVVAIVGEYNGDKQLYIRKLSEVNLNGERCTGGIPEPCDAVQSVSQNFSTAQSNIDLSIDCWINKSEIGSRLWRGRSGTDANAMHVQATAFGGSSQERSWLISPPISASGSNTLSFDSQVSFWTHNACTVWISTNFDGVNTASATWIPITATLAGQSSGSAWVNSGILPLSGYLPQGFTGTFYIGFRYDGNGATSLTTSFRLDNININ